MGQNNAPPGTFIIHIRAVVKVRISVCAGGYLELERHKLQQQHKNEAHIPPLLGVAPLGIVPLSKEHQFQYR